MLHRPTYVCMLVSPARGGIFFLFITQSNSGGAELCRGVDLPGFPLHVEVLKVGWGWRLGGCLSGGLICPGQSCCCLAEVPSAPGSSRLQTLPLLAAGPRLCLTSGKAVSLFLWQSACETQDDTASETDKKFPSQAENTPVVLELVRTGSYHYACSIFPPGACSITMPGSPKLIAVLNNKIDCFLL